MDKIAKAVAYFRLGRVGALFYLLFLQAFQPHVLQVRFLLQCSSFNASNLRPRVFSSQSTPSLLSPAPTGVSWEKRLQCCAIRSPVAQHQQLAYVTCHTIFVDD